jgi:hypothetical protein
MVPPERVEAQVLSDEEPMVAAMLGGSADRPAEFLAPHRPLPYHMAPPWHIQGESEVHRRPASITFPGACAGFLDPEFWMRLE